jgi:hypothetical protein
MENMNSGWCDRPDYRHLSQSLAAQNLWGDTICRVLLPSKPKSEVHAGFRKTLQERHYATIITLARKIPENVLQEGRKLLMWHD